jgi:hypothetical protein
MERLLDVRDLEPPEPLERILAALADLGEDDWLRVRHRREPYPLYGLLRNMDFLWRGLWSNGELEILIWPANRPAPDGGTLRC